MLLLILGLLALHMYCAAAKRRGRKGLKIGTHHVTYTNIELNRRPGLRLSYCVRDHRLAVAVDLDNGLRYRVLVISCNVIYLTQRPNASAKQTPPSWPP